MGTLLGLKKGDRIFVRNNSHWRVPNVLPYSFYEVEITSAKEDSLVFRCINNLGIYRNLYADELSIFEFKKRNFKSVTLGYE